MKLPPRKYPLESFLEIFFPMKIPTMFIAKWANPTCGNSSGNYCFATNEKTDWSASKSLKSRIMKIKG